LLALKPCIVAWKILSLLRNSLHLRIMPFAFEQTNMQRMLGKIMKKHFDVLFLSVSAALVLSACGQSASTPKTASLQRGSISQTVEATGAIASSNEARLSFQQAGVVETIGIKIGDSVKAGDVLATLQTIDLALGKQQAEAQLQQSKNNVRNAEQALIVAQANYSRTVQGTRDVDLKAAQAGVQSAQANFERVTRGQAADAKSAKAAYDAAKANYDKVIAGPTAEDLAGLNAQLQNAEAALRSAQANYDRARRQDPAGIGAHPSALTLEQTTNAYTLAKANYDKSAKGADSAAIRAAEQQVASAQANYARFYGATYAANKSAAEQQIASAQASAERLSQPARDFDLSQLGAQIEQARIAIDNARVAVKLNEIALAQADRRIEQATLRAPFGAVIGSVNARPGESVSSASPAGGVVVLADTTGYHIGVTVDELDVANLRQGQPANVRVDALPGETFVGLVERISSTSTKLNGVVNYNVRVKLDQAGDKLKSGMSATTLIELARRENVLLAPSNALKIDPTTRKTLLTVRDGNQNREVEVSIGLRDSNTVEILSGVDQDALIVLP
jgi:HlyD family secretion protein